MWLDIIVFTIKKYLLLMDENPPFPWAVQVDKFSGVVLHFEQRKSSRKAKKILDK